MDDHEVYEPEGSPQTMSPALVALEPDPQGVRVRIVGELDLATAPELDRILDELLGQKHERVLIDLSGVGFMDSTGLSSLIRAHGRAERSGRRMTMLRGSPQVQRLLEITGTLNRLPFED